MDIKADGTCSKTFCELVEPETRKQEGNHLLLARSALVSSTRVAELSEEIIHSNLSWKENWRNKSCEVSEEYNYTANDKDKLSTTVSCGNLKEG